MPGRIDCVFCEKNNVNGTTFTKYNKCICNDCLEDIYDLFKHIYYVKKVKKITDLIEKKVEKALK